ncbi:DUF1702 family protein [Streptomyces sp. ST2-7A]|uniref:DUF1702 family protein n=1 Tax=Streptomyces sp. ST2-7A TaxID=2907214 RepID=UPI001F2909D6|nr:DUF1702 family protein [Streptomyces sp. ST2-7A]MCE7079500.1 DUF1702 family protein [Streptomyces sp. ST2-7A]
MSSFVGKVRGRILTPSVRETALERRGFHRKDAVTQQNLETVGRMFLSGFSTALAASSCEEAEEDLEKIPPAYRGFAYEGAGMGATIHDALPGHRGRLAGLLAGRGRRHVYMVHVGIGWAMARLPKPLWPDVRRTDPLLRWLILDGYGFHQAYFHTDRYVRRPHEPLRFSWRGGPDDYAARVIDQGIGRALWFVGGACPDRVAELVASFPEHRRADLYAGTGLAATYAGSVTEHELRALLAHAGVHRHHLAQGAAFAAEARLLAGIEVPHTGRATSVLCGMGAAEAARICSERRPVDVDRCDEPAYEEWRREIAAAIALRTTSGGD